MPYSFQKLLWPSFIILFLLTSCVGPKVAFNRRTDFSKIHRVAVATFSGPNGEVAADILTQDLMAAGADMIERQRLETVLKEQNLAQSGVLDPETTKKLHKILGIDAIIVGSVSSYSPGQSYLVQTGHGKNYHGDNVTPLSNRHVYSRGPAAGLNSTEVISTAASVGLIARMVDVETGSILWSARMSYEGFDAQTALSTISESFVNSLVPLWSTVLVKN